MKQIIKHAVAKVVGKYSHAASSTENAEEIAVRHGLGMRTKFSENFYLRIKIFGGDNFFLTPILDQFRSAARFSKIQQWPE